MNLSEKVKKTRMTAFIRQELFVKEIGVLFAAVNRLDSGKTMNLLNDYCRKNDIDFDIVLE